MKRGITPLTLLCVFVFTGGCSTLYLGDDDWLGGDKLYHFVAAGVIGAGVTSIALNNGMDDSRAPVAGFSSAVGIGVAKEVYDARVKGTFFSVKDLAWDILGGAAGSISASANGDDHK